MSSLRLSRDSLPLRAVGGVLGICCLSLPAVSLAGGSVKVSSDIVGMRIFIDGADTGLDTPATVGNLSAGRHEVRVRGDCRVGAALVEVAEGETVPAKLATALGRGLLTVEASPAGAAIQVDGASITGPTPVSCGEHSVRVTHPGHLQAVLKVEVDVDERRVLPVELEELGTATLVMTVSPEHAEVVLDGRVLGTGSITDGNVPAGPHIIEVRADGFKAASQQLLVDAGETRAYTFDLRPLEGAVAAAPPADTPKDGPPAGRQTSGGAGLSPLKATGIGVAVAGVGLGIFGITRFGKAADAYQEYVDRSANGPGPESEVTAIRDDEIVPMRNAGLITTGLGTALLAGGVTLVVAF